MKNKRKILSLVLALLFFSVFHGCVANAKSQKEKDLNSKDVTLITKVYPTGEKVSAVACDFGSIVDITNLSSENFKIESFTNKESKDRTITKVYTNNTANISDNPKAGRYVIIELDPNDENSSTLTYDEKIDQTVRNKLEYYVTILKDIKTKNGSCFKASNRKVLFGKEVTPIVQDFKNLLYKDSQGNKLNYRLFEPKKKSNEKYPLVVFLHGSGERGGNNYTQLLSSKGAVGFADPESQAKNPCYVLAPQANHTNISSPFWCEEPLNSTLLNLIKDTIKKYHIDTDRIYVTGLSNGGDGVYNLLEKNPELFAAGIPICGISNSNYDATKLPGYTPVNPSHVEILKNIPIWVFQAADDPAVDIRNSREIVDAIKKAGGTLINFTEYPAGTIIPGHLSWVKAYENKDLIDWLFKQKK